MSHVRPEQHHDVLRLLALHVFLLHLLDGWRVHVQRLRRVTNGGARSDPARSTILGLVAHAAQARAS